MKVRCNACIENPMQRDNLRQCIEILGGKPEVSGCGVFVEFFGDKEQADKYIQLFEQYHNHAIFTFDD